MTPPADRLNVLDRQAVDLAHRLRCQMGRWLTVRGIITAHVGISPYVNPASLPGVVICMDHMAAESLIRSLDETGTAALWPGRHR